MAEKKLYYAGFWRRLSASLVDILITTPVLISLLYLFGFERYLLVEINDNLYSYIETKNSDFYKKLIDILSTVIVSLYSIFFISSKYMATPGKMLFGIKVVDKEGNQLTKMRALARFYSSIFFTSITFGIGILMIAFTKEKTALYDIICSTRVIKKTNGKRK